MNQAEILIQLVAIFREVFRRNDVVLTAQTTADDVSGWDSFKQIEIAVAIEERFNIRLRTREMSRLKDVGALAELVMDKLAER